MNNSPLVSIVIPIYNAESYLSQCLESVFNQTYKNIEVICVNDGSTDGCLDVLKKYASHNDNLKIIDIENSGVSNARNVALKYLAGSMVMFVDADDWIDINCVEILVNFMIKHECDVVMFPYLRERGKSSLKCDLFDKQIVFQGDDCRQLARLMIGPIKDEITSPAKLNSYATVWGKLYRKEVLDGIYFIDLSVIGSAEDSLFNMFVFKRAKVVGYCPDLYYHYRRNNNSSLTENSIVELKEKRKVMYGIIADNFRSSEENEALTNRIAIDVLSLLINAHISKTPHEGIRDVLNDDYYHSALEKLNFSKFQLHWRIFYSAARNKRQWLIEVLLNVINFIRHQ